MALNLTGALGDVANLASSISAQDVLSNMIIGAGGTLLISGLQTQQGQNAVDPLHIFIHNPAPTSAPASSGGTVTGVVQGGGGVITMSQFMALSPDGQKTVQALKYTIVPG